MNYKGYIIEPNLTGYVNFHFYKIDDEIIKGYGNSVVDCTQQIDDYV